MASTVGVAAPLPPLIAAGVVSSPAGVTAGIAYVAAGGGAATLRWSAGAFGLGPRRIGGGQGVSIIVLFLNGQGSRGPLIDFAIMPASDLGGSQLLLVVREDNATRTGV